MNDVVDRVLNTYQLMRNLEANGFESSREKIAGCIEKLNTAGRFDAHQLAVYGLAYLKQLHEGTDPRFTGC